MRLPAFLQKGTEFPDLKWAEDVAASVKYTPDVAYIEQFYAQNVFIYNECMSTGRAKDLLTGSAIKHSTAFTLHNDFVMWKKNLGKVSFPLATKSSGLTQGFGEVSSMGTPGKIKGELFAMRPYKLIELDNYLRNTVFFDRRRVTIEIPYGLLAPNGGRSVEGYYTTRIRAWMYFANEKFWHKYFTAFNGFKPVQMYAKADSDLTEKYYFYREAVENNAV